MTIAPDVQRHKTAMTRYSMSVPMQALGRHGYLDGGWAVFDYGCGRGGDLEILARNGVPASGWDPHYRPDSPKQPADVVNLGYVLNVIEDARERQHALRNAFALAEKVLAVSAMLESAFSGRGDQFADGVLTARGTFQKYYTQDELGAYIAATLDDDPVAVAPGVFFVFKDKNEEQRFLEHRQRNRRGLDRLIQRIPKPTREEREQAFYEANRNHLDSVWDLWLTFGRPPRDDEIPGLEELQERIGSLGRVLAFLKRYHGDEAIALAANSRKDDLRVFFALLAFEHRSAVRSIPEELRRDVRALFSTLQQAREEGHQLLFSAGDSEQIEASCREAMRRGLGSLDEDMALTIHTELVSQLPALLRVYIGCASKLYGDVISADLLKVHTASGKLTLMSYDGFESTSLPRMKLRTKVDLRKQRVDTFEYGEDFERPYLYWKSKFIADDFPNYSAQRSFDEELAELNVLDSEGYGPSPAVLEKRLSRSRLLVNGFRIKGLAEPAASEDACGLYLTFGDVLSAPENAKSFQEVPGWIYPAIGKLALSVLDPVIDYFGGIELLGCHWSGRPASEEAGDRKAKEIIILEAAVRGRKSVAVSFHIQDESMLEVGQWIAENADFHRLVLTSDSGALAISVAAVGSRGLAANEVGILEAKAAERIRWCSKTNLGAELMSRELTTTR